MFTLKSLSKEAVPAALEKAQCFRFLSEPGEAESICLDILEIEPGHQAALVTLVLALTDQFGKELNPAFTKARELLSRFPDEYSKTYYNGVICERRAKAHLEQRVPGFGRIAHEWLSQAMASYERAIDISVAGSDEAILRWNTCARILMKNPEVAPVETENREQMLE